MLLIIEKMDMMMPILDGESAARMIKSTKNANQDTPIVAVTSYELKDVQLSEQGTVFSAVSALCSIFRSVLTCLWLKILQKPVLKAEVLSVLKRLGFQALQQKSRTESKPPSPVSVKGLVTSADMGGSTLEI